MNLRREVWAIICTFLNQVFYSACMISHGIEDFHLGLPAGDYIPTDFLWSRGSAFFLVNVLMPSRWGAREFGFDIRFRTGRETLFRQGLRRRILSGSASFCKATVLNYRKNAMCHFGVMTQSNGEDEACPGNLLRV